MLLQLADFIAAAVVHIDDEIVVFAQHDALEHSSPDSTEVDFEPGTAICNRRDGAGGYRIASCLVVDVRRQVTRRQPRVYDRLTPHRPLLRGLADRVDLPIGER